MLSLRRIFGLGLVLTLALPAWAAADDEPDLMQILGKADAATRAVKKVAYDAEFFGVGELKDKVGRVKGSVKARPGKRSLLGVLTGSGGGQVRLRVDGSLQKRGTNEKIAFKIASDGRQVFCIDETEKVFYQAKLSQAHKLLSPARSLWMLEYLHATPFSDEMNGKARRYEGIKKIGEVDCHVIYVVYLDSSESRWFFGTEDYLPRGVDRIVKLDSDSSDDSDADNPPEAATALRITNLDIEPDLDLTVFSLERPKGYEKEDPQSDRGPKLLDVGKMAPNWKLKTPGGERVSLDELRGNVVVMDFWATWCGPCKEAMPNVQKLHERFKDKPVKVFGVNCWERGDPVEYMKEKQYTYGLLLDADKVAEAYKVSGIPTFYIIAPDGKIAYAETGSSPDEVKKIAKVVDKLLDDVP
ncbi:MAG: TlpA disulfide reductase family protein [Planctomycetota bacterium]